MGSLEAGGSQLLGGGRGAENIFFLLFKFQKGKSPDQTVLVSYLKPFSFGLGEV